MYTNNALIATHLMEKLTLNAQCHEIVINNGALDGAIDLFSYGPENEHALRPLGSLYIVGHRTTDSGNMGYIVSLIAALARREYYAQTDLTPREAFARMLKKVNEIVDDFFKSSSVDVSVGIFAVAGSSILVSKLDKFKILLARDGQAIDILNNVALFNKEHIEQRRFSSIISGAIQPGDRILAYYPSRPVTTRERALKSHLTKLATADLVTKLEDIGREHTSFAAAMLCIDMVQSSEPAVEPEIQPAELKQPEPEAAPVPHEVPATYAWAPRQSPTVTKEIEETPEVPHIISTEFALGTRRTSWSKIMHRVRVVRLDGRGKAIFLGTAAVTIIVGVLIAKSVFMVDPAEQKITQTIESAKADLAAANAQIAEDPNQARQLLMRALSAVTTSDLAQEKSARALTASLIQAMDQLDNAHAGMLSLVAQPDPKTDTVIAAVWASASHTLWSVTKDNDGVFSVGRLSDSGIDGRTALGAIEPSQVFPLGSGAVILDATAHSVTRVDRGTAKTFAIPTQDTILSGSMYEGSLYLLTSTGILKVADLDTDKPVTKQWLTAVGDLAPDAAQLYVDGSIWTLSRDGTLTEYYKGKKKDQTSTALAPSGIFRLLAGPESGQFAIANSSTKRVYIISASDARPDDPVGRGSLIRTITIDTDQPILHMLSGPDTSTLIVTKDNKIWSVK